jgi:hypothetical protein
MKSKHARDAAAKAKIEAEASSLNEEPLHLDNEWNIRYRFLSEIMHVAPPLFIGYYSLTSISLIILTIIKN